MKFACYTSNVWISPHKERSTIFDGQHPQAVEDEQQVAALCFCIRHAHDGILEMLHLHTVDSNFRFRVSRIGNWYMRKKPVLVDDVLRII